MAGCDILASMKQKLQSTGLYRLDGSTLVDAELQAYAAAMQALADEIWKLEQEGFVQTAGGDGLELWERACGNVRDTLSTADRREMLCSRLRVTPNDYTAGKLQDALLAAGILAHVAEIENHTVYINVLGTAEIQREMSPEEIFTVCYAFISHGILPRLVILDLVDQKERVSVGDNLLDLFHIQTVHNSIHLSAMLATEVS